MYAAIWIDESKAAANEKIVVCNPLMSRLNAAVAVLNSQRRADAPSLILSGESTALKAFLASLDKADDSWGEANADSLIDSIISRAGQMGLSTVDYDEATTDAVAAVVARYIPLRMFAGIQLVLAVRKEPKPKMYPNHITPEAKPLWDKLVVEHKKVLNRFKSDKKKMWAAAIILLKRLAAQKNVKPFSRDPAAEHLHKTLQKEGGRDLSKEATNSNFRALKEVSDVFDRLKGEALVSRLTSEKFYEVEKSRSIYYITTYQVAKVRRTVEPRAVIDRIAATSAGWSKVRQVAKRKIDSYTSVLAEPEGPDVVFYMVTGFTRDQVILILDIPEDTSDAKILKRLGTAGRKWVKTGVMV